MHFSFVKVTDTTVTPKKFQNPIVRKVSVGVRPNGKFAIIPASEVNVKIWVPVQVALIQTVSTKITVCQLVLLLTNPKILK